MDVGVKLAFDLVAFISVMVLIVLGLGVIASMMGIFNFAHGEFLLLGAYVVYLAHSRGWPVWTGMVAAPVVVGLVGLALERSVIRRFYAEPVVAMLGTYAVGLAIRESIRGLIGGLYHSVPEPLAGSFDLQHLTSLQPHETRVCQIEGYREPKHTVRIEEFFRQPCVRQGSDIARLQLPMETLDP